MSVPTEDPAELDRTDPERHVVARARRPTATGVAGERTTLLGTLNFIDDAKRARAAALVRTGRELLARRSRST